MSSFGTARGPRGAALVITMLVMAVLLLAGTTFMTISSTESQIALNEQASTLAVNLAEAGLQRAIANLNASSSYSGETRVSLGAGTLAVTVAASDSGLQLCSGTAKDVAVTASVPVRGRVAQSQVKATVDKVSTPFQWGAFGLDHLYLLSWMTQSRVDGYSSKVGTYSTASSTSDSSVGSNSNLYLWSMQVLGNATTAGAGIGTGGSTTVSGTSTVNATAQSFPTVTAPVAPTTALSVGASSTTTLASGTYEYTSLSLGNGSTLKAAAGARVTIYVTGNLTAGSSVTVGGTDGSITVIAKSDGTTSDMKTFTIGDGFKLYGAFYGTNTRMLFGDNAEIYGSMIARDVLGNWSYPWNLKAPAIHYNRALSSQLICHSDTSGSYGYKIIPGTFREVVP